MILNQGEEQAVEAEVKTKRIVNPNLKEIQAKRKIIYKSLYRGSIEEQIIKHDFIISLLFRS